MKKNLFLTLFIIFFTTLSILSSDEPQMITFLAQNGIHTISANSPFVTDSSIIQDFLENNTVDISNDFDINTIAMAQEYYDNPQDFMNRQSGSVWRRYEPGILKVLEFFDLDRNVATNENFNIPEIKTFTINANQKELNVPVDSKLAENSPLIQQALEKGTPVDATNFDISIVGFAINYYNDPEDPTNSIMYEFNKDKIDEVIKYLTQPIEEEPQMIALIYDDLTGSNYKVAADSPFIKESSVITMIEKRKKEQDEKFSSLDLSDFDMNTIFNATEFYNNPQKFLTVQHGIKWERYGDKIMELLDYLDLSKTERVQKALRPSYAIYQMLMQHDGPYVELPTYAGQAELYFEFEDEIPDTFVDINQLIEYAEEENREKELLEKLIESGIKFIDFRPFYDILDDDVVNDLITEERRGYYFFQSYEKITTNIQNPFPFIFFEKLNPEKKPNCLIRIIFAGKLIGRYFLSINLHNSKDFSEILSLTRDGTPHVISTTLTEEKVNELRQEEAEYWGTM